MIVAKESREFCRDVAALFNGLPINVLTAGDGEKALELIRQHSPSVALLDVALPKIFGFQLCDIIKSEASTRDTRVILLAAINDKTRYKRLPESLYGADDYLEIHHVPDKLVPMIKRLDPSLSEQQTPSNLEKERRASREPVSEQSLPEELKNGISRLARTILSDIALYNQKKIEEGVRDKNLEMVLSPELEEGVRLMKQRFKQIPEPLLREFLSRESDLLIRQVQRSEKV
jgi:CheY-like chemotaxis protein